MANKIQIKRGTNLTSAGTPDAGELIYKSDTNQLFVGDGSTAATALTAIGGTPTSGSNNQILTDDGSGGINSESSLTFDGDFKVTGTGNSTFETIDFDGSNGYLLLSGTASQRMEFRNTTTNANGWIGIPSWNTDAWFFYGPTSTGNRLAYVYEGDYHYFKNGHLRLDADDQKIIIGVNNDLELLAHGTAGDSRINVNNNTLLLTYNGQDRFRMNSAGLVLNEGGGNYDFRVEGDTDANLFFVDASADKIGIGTTSPDELFDVNGVGKVRGDSSEGKILELGQLSYNAAVPAIIVNYWDDTSGGSSGLTSGDHFEFYNPRYGFRHTWARGGAGGAVPVATLQNNSSNGVFELFKALNPTIDATYQSNVKLNVNGDSYFRGGSVTIGDTSPLTTGGTPRLSVRGAGFNIGNGTNDMSYIRSIVAGEYQWQTWNGANNGELQLQPYGGKVAIGNTTPGELLHVDGGIEFAGRKYYRGTVGVAGAGELNGQAITLGNELGTTLNVNYQYKITLNTTGTGTDTGAVYVLTYDNDGAAWDLRLVSRAGSNSNHPLAFVDGSNLKVYHNHSGTYNILYFVELWDMSADDGTLHGWGSDYQWQRDVDNLYYNDGNIGIGTATPDAKLEVTGSTNSDLFSLEGAGSSFKLIAESGSTGSANIMAYRLGLRYGVNDNGFIDFYRGPDGATGFLTFGTSGTEKMRIDSSGNVGIGQISPSYKLDISHTGSGLRLNSTGDQQLRFTRSGGNDISIEHDANQFYFYNRSTSKVLMLMANSGDVRVGHNSNPSLEIRNTATAAGSGPSLVFGHDQSGTNSTGRISTYLTDGNNATRSAVVRHWYRQSGTEHLGLQLGDSSGYLRLYRIGDSSDYLEIIRNTDHSQFRIPGGGNYHKFVTDSGYLQIGPQNGSHCHYTTDRANHWFNQMIYVNGGVVSSYNSDLQLRRNGASSDRIDVADTYIRTITDNAETFRFGSTNRSFNTLVVGPINNNSKAYIRANNGYSTSTTPDYTWYYNDQCGIYHPAANTIGFSASGQKVLISTYGLYSADDIYINHGGSGYSTGLQFMGGSNTPGANEYENAKLAYYDNAGTGFMRYDIGRSAGAHEWYIGGTRMFSFDQSGNLVLRNDGNTQGASIQRVGQIQFTWDRATYGNSNNHAIVCDSDNLIINSFDDVTINLDSNNNDGSETFNIRRHSTSLTGGELLFEISGTGNSYTMAASQVGNGSAAAPSLSFYNDTDLGFYRAGANSMRFSAGNSIRGTWNGEGLELNGGSLGVNATPHTTDGVIRASNDVIAYYSSDERLKENVKPIENALDKVSKIRGVEFDWIVNEEIHPNEGHDVGVIAQEIEKVLPEVVETRDSGYKAVKYEKIVSLLIEAINEQQQQINELKEKLNG